MNRSRRTKWVAKALAAVLIAAGTLAGAPVTRWYPVPVTVGPAFIPTGVYLGIPFEVVEKPLSAVTKNDPVAAQTVQAFYSAAARGDAARLGTMLRVPAKVGTPDQVVKQLKAGIGDLKAPVIEGVIPRTGGRAAVIVKGTPIRGNAVRIHWLEPDGQGGYLVVQQVKSSDEDALINVTMLATAKAPQDFKGGPLPAGPGRQTAILRQVPDEPAVALQVNFEGVKVNLPIFDPATKTKDPALLHYINAYRALKAGRIADYKAALAAPVREMATKGLQAKGDDAALLQESLAGATILYVMRGRKYDFVFFARFTDPSIIPLGALHEGVIKEEGGRYSIKPASDLDVIDQILSEDEFQARVLRPLMNTAVGPAQ